MRHGRIALMAFLLMGCSTPREELSQREIALQRLDAAAERLAEIQVAMTSILQRRTIVLAAPGALTPTSISRPSEVLDRLLRDRKAPHAKAYTEFLNDAASGRQVRAVYSSGCMRQSWTEEEENAASFVPPNDSSRLAKRLDAVAVIRIEDCKKEGIPLNSPRAALPNDTWAIAVAKTKAKDEAMNAPFKLSPEDYRPMMLGQAFRFASVDDSDIPVPHYLAKRADKQLERTRSSFLPLAKNGKTLKVVFDRDVTASRVELRSNPKGWFNAFAERDAIYISPTLIRAAFVSCAKRTNYSPSLLNRLRTEERPRLADRRITANDSSGIVGIAEKLASAVDDCVDDELGFLLAHELAHSMLGVVEEERADCVARSAVRFSGRDSVGIFDDLIFQVARSEDADILGASHSIVKQIGCRERLQNNFPNFLQPTLQEAIKACTSKQLQCEAATSN